MPASLPSKPGDLVAVNHPSQEYFLAACGSDEPLRLEVVLGDAMQIETRTFPQPFLVIGRRPESDLSLDHWQVSRRHAYLQMLDGRFYCVDLGSRTGTHGGDSTERSGWLEPGRAIHIGPYTVRPEWPTPREESSGPYPGVTWEMPGREIGQELWRMEQQLILIGRSPACKIRIPDRDVSMFHCSVVLTPSGVWVIDLLGQKGVFVNDEPIRCVRMEDGDTLRVGHHTLRARYDTPPLPMPPTQKSSPEPARNGLANVGSSKPFRVKGPVGELVARMAPPMPPENQDLATFVERPGTIVDPSINLLVHQFGLMQQQMFDQFHQTMMMMFEGFASLHREQASTIREEFEQVRKLSQEIEALRIETAKLAEAATTKPVERPRLTTNGHPLPASQPPPSVAKNPPNAEPIKRAAPPLPDPDVDIHAQLCLRLATIQTERQNRWQKIMGMMSSRS